MHSACDLVSKTLRDPVSVLTLTQTELDLLVRQARWALLMPRLAIVLRQHGLLDRLDAAPRAHFIGSLVITDKQDQAIRWEVSRIQAALKNIGTDVVLLKGAAYVMAGLPAAQGRFFSDVDILVPKGSLGATEAALMLGGWVSTHHNAYDQRYYRTWMHELPPMLHLKRQTVLDVHHNILPETARLHPDPQALLAAAMPLPDHPGLRVLSPVDMVLHSATHLFHEGEFEHGLRGLTDIDALLRHFSDNTPQFWGTLIERAGQLDLQRPLFYALRYSHSILDTPIPDPILTKANQDKPHPMLLKLMDALFHRAFRPHHASCRDWFTPLALWLLFVRSHWLRMPPHLLIPHLLHQAFARPESTST